MTKDSRYKTIKLLIEGGHISVFSQIFEEHKFPVTTLARFLGTNHTRLTKYIQSPDLFTFGEATRIAAYFEVEQPIINKLIFDDMLERRKNKQTAIKKVAKKK